MAQKKTITIEAKDNTKQAFNNVKKNLNGMEGSVNKTKKSMEGLKTAIKGALGALTIGAFVQATRSTLDYADALGKTSARLGLTTQNLQTLRFAATQSGMTTEALEMGMQRFTRRLAEAGRGTGVLKDTFKTLGMSIKNTDGTLKSAETMLGEVADKMASIPDQGERVRLAFQMFDSEGVKMVNVLQNGSGALADMRQKLIDTGAILEEDFIRQSEEANDAIDLLQNQIKSGFGSAISGLAPVIKKVANVMGEMIEWAREHPTITKFAAAITALGVAVAFVGGPIVLALSALSGIVALVQKYNEMGIDNKEVLDLQGKSMESLTLLSRQYEEQLKAIREELEGLPFNASLKSAFQGLKKQESVLEGQVEQIQKQITLLQDQKKKAENIHKVTKDKYEVMKMSNKELEKYTDHMFKTQGAHQKLLNQMREEKKVRYSQPEHALEEIRVENAEKYDELLRKIAGDLGYLMDKEAEQRALYGEGMVMGQEAEDLKKQFHNQEMERIQAEIDLRNQALQTIISTAKATGDILYQEGIMGFEAMRALAYAEAMINAHVSATKAMASLPPPWNMAAAAASYAYGVAQAIQIKNMEPPKRKREFGGSVMAGQSVLVGERGAEMFTPNTAGTISPSGSFGGSANVTFNINAVDAKGFESLLYNKRGMIVSMINQALNREGRRSLI